MGRQEQVALGLEVNIVLVNLHDFRSFTIEQGAFDFMSALGSGNAHVDGGGEVAGLISLYFLDLNVALFRHARSVDEVNAFLENGVQQSL